MAVGKVTIDKGIKPVFQGNFKEAALNGLMNLSETLDIFANPIKGIFLEKGNPIKGFINGIGIGSEGRKNYDWDVSKDGKYRKPEPLEGSHGSPTEFRYYAEPNEKLDNE